METWGRALGVAILLALLIGFAWIVLRPHEPTFQGRPLSSWMEEAAASGAYRSTPRPTGYTLPADAALRSLGASAIPLLLHLAGTSQTPFRGLVGNMAESPALDYLHLPPQNYKQYMAVRGFELLGPEARPAVPQLARLLAHHDHEVQVIALRCLAALGPDARDAVPAIIQLMGNVRAGNGSLWRLSMEAAQVLGEIGPAASAAIPSLMVETNEAALLALIRIRGGSFDPFFERLRDSSNGEQWMRTANQVFRLGAAAEAAVPLIIPALDHTNQSIRFQAIALLGHIHRRPDLCLPALTPLLQSPDDQDREQALLALGNFGPDARSASSEVVRLLRDRSQSIRSNATNVLNLIDPEAALRARPKPKSKPHDSPAHR